jgi:hypothetical protein
VPPFPFIIGFERSGTTLLRAIVDAHPDIAVGPESPFVANLAPQWAGDRGLDVEALVADLVADWQFHRWLMAPDDVRAVLTDAAPADYPDAVRALFASWAEREGKPRYGDKTPRNLLWIDRLAELFPEARFVHLIRDGRDVAASYAAEFPLPVPRAIQRWARRLRIGRAAGAALGPDRYREIRYEDLVADPEPVVREVCELFELSFDPTMLRHEEQVDRLFGRMLDISHHQRVALPVTPGLRDWRTQMSPEDVALCEEAAGDLLAELGYELSGAPPSLRARARMVRIDLGMKTRRVGRRARLLVTGR